MKRIRKPRIWDNKNKKFIPYYSIMFYANNGPINLCIPDDKGGAANMVNAKKFDVEFPSGITDKNGKEIYEGDRVNVHDVETDDNSNDVVATVFWTDGAFYLEFPEGTYVDCRDNIRLLGDTILEPYTTLEVVGNIHENL